MAKRKRKPAVEKSDAGGNARRESRAAWSRRDTATAADIGELPKVVNRRRRNSCRLDLHKFLRMYFPETTGLSPFSEDHERVIDRIQRCILQGGWFVNAVYRGFAKTTISENAALWALLYGHRKYVPIFGASDDAAEENIESLQIELLTNDLLLEDFPEVCFPVRKLGGKHQGAKSQTYHGALTHLEWKSRKLVLPTIPKSVASGGIVVAKGLGSASRGMKHKRADGENQRPDFVIIDDPQTDDGAESRTVCDKLERRIKRAICKLGSHRRKIAIVINATVICEDDLIDRLTDHKANPSFEAERVPMVKSWATSHDSFWMDKYAETVTNYDPDVLGAKQKAREKATRIYRRNRKKADAGCVVSWSHCYAAEDGEISAIQHAYNELIELGEEAFASECQVSPTRDAADVDTCTAEDIRAKTNGLRQGELPADAQHVTAFIDVHQHVLYYLVGAWAVDFTGYVIDYGTWPKQSRNYISHAAVNRTLGRQYKGHGKEAAIAAGLRDLVAGLVDRKFARDDGAELQVERLLIDAAWETTTVNAAVRQIGSAVVHPSQGVGIGAKKKPMAQYRNYKGDRAGHHWRMPAVKGRRRPRTVNPDTNFWKSFAHERLRIPIGDPSAWSLWGRAGDRHKMLADHVTAEKPKRITYSSEWGERTVDEWELIPNRDNHLLDCLCGAAVAAQMQGVSLPAWRDRRQTKARKRKKVRYLS